LILDSVFLVGNTISRGPGEHFLLPPEKDIFWMSMNGASRSKDTMVGNKKRFL
jgi:hypothetical protein